MGEKDKREKLFVSCADVFSEIFNVLIYRGEKVLSEDRILAGPTESVYAETAEKLCSQF